MNINNYNNIQIEINNLINDNNNALKSLKSWKKFKICMTVLSVLDLLFALIFTSLGTDSTDLFFYCIIGVASVFFADKQIKTFTSNIESNNQKLNYLNSIYYM